MTRESDWIERIRRIPFWSSLSHRTDRSRRRGLACGECVVLVIEHDIGDIEIAAAGVNEVTHTDTIAITITTHDDDSKFWISEFHPCGEWDRATMKRLCCITIDVLRCLS